MLCFHLQRYDWQRTFCHAWMRSPFVILLELYVQQSFMLRCMTGRVLDGNLLWTLDCNDGHHVSNYFNVQQSFHSWCNLKWLSPHIKSTPQHPKVKIFQFSWIPRGPLLITAVTLYTNLHATTLLMEDFHIHLMLQKEVLS